MLLVGDAAGVDAFAGEAISFALHYGKIAAAELATAFSSDDFSFASYQAKVARSALGRSLRLRLLLGKLLYRGWSPLVIEAFFQGNESHDAMSVWPANSQFCQIDRF